MITATVVTQETTTIREKATTVIVALREITMTDNKEITMTDNKISRIMMISRKEIRKSRLIKGRKMIRITPKSTKNKISNQSSKKKMSPTILSIDSFIH